MIAPRPLLKWAGGKRQLLPQLRRFYPDEFGTYHEPFLGSGAVFFDLWQLGKLRNRRAILTDDNADLIGCYLRVRDNTSEVIGALERLAQGHERHEREHYYRVRDDLFNPTRRAWRESGGSLSAYTPELAAMLIYLNRTGYNGLFRLNSDGRFNVPAGRYAKPRICDEVNIRRVAGALSRAGVTLDRARFERTVDSAGAGDFLYFDPPYAPVSRTSRFTSYTTDGFDAVDQQRLRDVAVTLAKRGCHVVMSNSTAPDIARLYEDSRDVRSAGLKCYRVPARRAINSNSNGRGDVSEYLITNIGQIPLVPNRRVS